MSLTAKYALAGLLWGLILGYGMVAVTTGLGVAVLFTFVYGDGPWGEGAGGMLYGLAALGWTGSAVFCAGVGYVHGWRAQRTHQGRELQDEHRRAHLVAAAALLTAVLGGYQLYAYNAALTLRQDYLEGVLQARHEIRSLDVVGGGDARGLDVVISARGRREGRYVLEVSVSDERGRTLYTVHNELDAGAHDIHERVHVAYAAIVSAGAAGEGVGGGEGTSRLQLTLTARLTPLLAPRELRILPRHVAERYRAEDSPFHSTLQTSHVLLWHSAGGRRWIEGRDGQMHELIR